MEEQAELLVSSAYQARRRGEREYSIELYGQAAELFHDAGKTLREAHALRHIGDILRGEAMLDAAREYYERAIVLYERRRDRRDLDLANALRGYALLLEGLGDDPRALWSRVRELYVAEGVEAGVTECDKRLHQP